MLYYCAWHVFMYSCMQPPPPPLLLLLLLCRYAAIVVAAAAAVRHRVADGKNCSSFTESDSSVVLVH